MNLEEVRTYDLIAELVRRRFLRRATTSVAIINYEEGNEVFNRQVARQAGGQIGAYLCAEGLISSTPAPSSNPDVTEFVFEALLLDPSALRS